MHALKKDLLLRVADRVDKIKVVAFELTQAECPCGDCMGVGCEKCAQTGVDIESLKTIYRALAEAIEIVKYSEHTTIRDVVKELRRLSVMEVGQ